MSPDSTESSNGSVLSVLQTHIDEMTAHALVGFPLEACGLLVGHPDGVVVEFHPCENVAASSKLYTVSPRDMLRVDRAAEDAGLEVIGVMHSHTHTDPYPSPTDVAQAPDPGWHYLIVSLRDDAPMTRSFRIIDGQIHEEGVAVRTDH
ncbi:MAG: M67 family metallopeptidase [Microthrixaceae bacterium]